MSMNNNVKLRAALTYLRSNNKYAAALKNEFVYRNHAATNVALTIKQAREEERAAREWAEHMNTVLQLELVSQTTQHRS